MEGNYYRRIKKKKKTYKVKRFYISPSVQKKPTFQKKKGGLAGVIFLLYIICKYQENEVRSKCILNILNF